MHPSLVAAIAAGAVALAPPLTAAAADVTYGYETVNGVEIFFREAGDPSKQTLVLLHGFPSSSHQYRELLQRLSHDYHLIAPDYPGFGASAFPSPEDYDYTFENIAATMSAFLEQRGVTRYSLMMQDYGGPVGFRIAAANPERVNSLVIQNANIYDEGINRDTWAPILQLWEHGRGDAALESTIATNIFSLEGLRWQYTHGTRQPDAVLPDNWLLDHERLSRPGQHDLQLALFYDYRTNVAQYASWQSYLRQHQPPMLVVWGTEDAFFTVDGARAFKRDVKSAEVHLLDTGHFALEEDAGVIADHIDGFLQRTATVKKRRLK